MTLKPHSSITANLASAVSAPPEIKAPAWPISFGDNKKAESNLKQALAINPDGIDPNFFYGEFLFEQGKAAQAKTVLEHALNAAARPGREVADAGRRDEINVLLAKIASSS